MKKRDEIDSRYKWDLSVIYKDMAAFETDFAKAEKAIGAFPKHEKTMLSSGEALFAALRDDIEIGRLIDKLWSYASLNFSLDTSKNEYQALSSRVRSLAAKAGEASWFLAPYLLRLDEEALARFFAEYPALESYRRIIEKAMRRKPHMLSDECEALVSKLDDCFGTHDTVRSILANSDLRHGKVRTEDGSYTELTDASYITYMQSSDRRVRQSAFRTLYKTYGQFKNTFATLYDAMVREKCTLAKMRGYKSSLAASTYRDEVTPAIYEALIRSVHKALPILYDYYDLKREVLGLKRLHLYDIYAPLVGELNRTYPYEEAVREVLDTVKIFGEEYESTLRAGLCEKGWADVYPTKGKRGGAFSSGTPDTEPYILLNYTETFDDISTLAHEAGHSMHTYFSVKSNEPHNASYTIFVAEVASTVNELLLSHKKLRESGSDEERLYILNHLMETYKGTLFRQTMFAEFEKKMHEKVEKGDPLTAEVISRDYRRLVCRYFGKDVVCDREIDLEWTRIPHFYRSFYVYKYATCISAASAIVKRIEEEGAAYTEKYLRFLSAGDSLSPLESLRLAEIDMTDPAVITGAIDDFRAAIDAFREIYQKK